MKKTRWFPAHIKPVRKGVYQIHISRWPAFWKTIEHYAYWNGSAWSNSAYSPAGVRKQHMTGSIQSKTWRGLTEKAA